jgi:hypothetical protein
MTRVSEGDDAVHWPTAKRLMGKVATWVDW